MEWKTYKDSAAAAAAVCDVKSELPVETEILIPDYLPPVFKVVKCFADLVVVQAVTTAAPGSPKELLFEVPEYP